MEKLPVVTLGNNDVYNDLEIIVVVAAILAANEAYTRGKRVMIDLRRVCNRRC